MSKIQLTLSVYLCEENARHSSLVQYNQWKKKLWKKMAELNSNFINRSLVSVAGQDLLFCLLFCDYLQLAILKTHQLLSDNGLANISTYECR